MRQTAKVLLLITMTAAGFWASVAKAAVLGAPGPLKSELAHVGFDASVLPPIGHTQFCLRYLNECEAHGIDFRRRNIALTPERLKVLKTVNREVNRAIEPEVDVDSETLAEWVISPPTGDCKHYAITKRHELLARGWPSRALLLAEVVVPSGDHHLLLVIRTKDVDLVLDNLNANIRSVAMTYRQYQWVRIETPQNPKFWACVHVPNVMHSAMVSD